MVVLLRSMDCACIRNAGGMYVKSNGLLGNWLTFVHCRVWLYAWPDQSRLKKK